MTEQLPDAEALRWQANGGLPDNLVHRLLAYQLHIGLDGMTWTAFIAEHENPQRNAEQVMELVRG